MAKFWFLLVCSWFLVSESQGLEFYSQEFKSWYLYDNDWEGPLVNAFMTCFTKGYNLFIPTTTRESEELFKVLSPKIDAIWVGIWLDQTGIYNYQGETIAALDWIDQAEFSDVKYAVVMYKNGTYATVFTSSLFFFVCEKNEKKPLNENETEEIKKAFIKKEYTYANDYDALYKLHERSIDHDEAIFKCLKDNALLVVPESEIEAAYVFTLLPFHYKEHLWVGASNFNSDHHMTYEGTPLKDVYVKWAEDQPKNCTDCSLVVINGDGTYETRDPFQLNYDMYEIPVICKKKLSQKMVRISNSNDDQGLTFRLNEFQTSYSFNESMESSFIKAVMACATKGYILFTPRSDYEAAEVFKMLPSRITDIWVGVYARQQNNYQTLLGDKIKDIHWYNPNKRFRKKNLQLNRDGMYRDVPEATFLQYICSKTDQYPINEDEEAKLKEKYMEMGYTYWEDYDALYKPHADETTLYLAALICMAENASLIIPESKEETSDIFNLLPYNIAESVWIGVLKIDSEFMTLEGKHFKEMYVKWIDEQLLEYEGNDAVVIDRDGFFIPTLRLHYNPLICKKKIQRIGSGEDVDRLGFYIKEFKSWYLFDEKSVKSFLGAITTCLTRGYSLFTPRSEDEAKAVFNELPSEIKEIWIGIYAARYNDYLTIEGDMWNTTNWTQDKVRLMEERVEMFRNGTYWDVKEETNLHYVCKKREDSGRPITEEKADEMRKAFSKKGYVYWNDYKASYKRYLHKNHMMSVLVCLNDNAMLFIPESMQEAKTVLKRFKISDLWIGATKTDQNVFVTYEGKPLNDTYKNWNKVQPEDCSWDKGRGCDFVSMNENAYLEKTSPNIILVFVCKKKLPVIGQGFTDNVSALGPMYTFNESRQYYFLDALVYCAIIGETLFFPNDKYEMIWLFEHLPPSVDRIWVGVSSYQIKSFNSITGEKFKDANVTWSDAKKPFISASRDGVYNDLQNYEALPFVCRKPENPIRSSSLLIKWNLSKKGYVFWEEYGAMYKYYGADTSFGAVLKCMLEKATLFVPESTKEVKDVLDIVPLSQNTIWIGVRRFNNDSFRTFEGMPLGTIDVKWNSGQPNDCELCNFVAITRNHTYETAIWLDDRPFVCKKKIK